MNWNGWLLWGFLSTIVISTVSAGAQGLGLTRMNLPHLLGTMITPDRDRAKFYGFGLHLAAGWLFSLLYVFTFESLGAAGWWRGALIGLVHALFVLVALMAILPGIHPRMASERRGPSAGNLLEPPGFMAMHYGVRTPIAIVVSHVIFGAMLGAFYRLQ
jgi:uncharacterized membrane protein YagU involved in acid resistance